MITLWFAIAGLLLIAVIIIIAPLLKSAQSKRVLSDKQQNIDIFKERLHELEQEKEQNTLDEAGFLQLKLELEKSLLVDVEGKTEKPLKQNPVTTSHWLISAVISVTIISVSLYVYFQLGRSQDYETYLMSNAQAIEAVPTQTVKQDNKAAPSFDKMTAMLKEKLTQDPSDLQQWFLLANTYSVTGKFDKAAEAYASALKHMPENDPDIAAVTGSYAQMLFQAAGEVITPDTEKAMLAALTIDPLESSALILKGIQAHIANDVKGAITFWEKAKQKAKPNVVSRFLEPVITQAKAQLGEKPTPNTPVQTAKKPETAPHKTKTSAAKITLQVDLPANLKAQTQPDDIIFVFAQKEGSRMPLAAQRLQVKDLPTTIILDDSKSPMPTAKLSSVEFVNITARVSFSKQPVASAGDFFVTKNHVAVQGSPALDMLMDQIKK
jgi:cytochrome c-type biogenesis protein CcmH